MLNEKEKWAGQKKNCDCFVNVDHLINGHVLAFQKEEQWYSFVYIIRTCIVTFN